MGGLEPPRPLRSTDFKSGVSTDSTTLPKNQPSQVGGLRRQYSLKVIFISLSVRPQFFAAFGKFHFAANNISIDCRVSGLIIVTFQDFFVKGGRILVHKNLIGSNFCRIFLRPKMEAKANFGQRGLAYANTSSGVMSRTSSSTFMNCSIVSQSTVRSSPSLEYR